MEAPCQGDLDTLIINRSLEVRNYTTNESHSEDIHHATIDIYVRTIIHKILLPVVFSFGLVGNLFNLMILGRKTFRRGLNHIERSALIGLITLSVSDMLFCALGLPVAFLTTGAIAPSDDSLLVVGFFYGLYHVPLINTCLFASTWLIVWISMERYLAVCHPFQARIAIRTRRSTGAYVVIFVVALTLNLPLFVRNTVIRTPCLGACTCYVRLPSALWTDNPALRDAHEYAWAVFGTVLPFCLLTFCNMNILRAVCHADSLGAREGNSKTLSRVTTTLVIMVFLYLLLVTPSTVLTFLTRFTGDIQLNNYQLAISVTNLCQAVKFSSNFLLYCVTNKQFRDDVGGTVCKTSSRVTTQDSSSTKRYQLVTNQLLNQILTSKN